MNNPLFEQKNCFTNFQKFLQNSLILILSKLKEFKVRCTNLTNLQTFTYFSYFIIVTYRD